MNKITNNFNTTKNHLNFQGDTMEEPTFTDDDKRRFMIENVAKELAENVQEKIPKNGTFASEGIPFIIDGTNNIGILEVSYNAKDKENLRDIDISVKNRYRDRTYKNFGVFTGTKQEIIDYLNNINIDSTLNDVMHLSDKVDEYFNQL